MIAYRVHYYILNYDCWHHYEDFDNLDQADKYAKYLSEQSDICGVGIVKTYTDKLYSR